VALNGSAATGGRWRLPSRYYSFTRQVAPGGDTMLFVVLDTMALTGGANALPSPAQLPSLSYPPGPAGAPPPAFTPGQPSAGMAHYAGPVAQPSARRRRRSGRRQLLQSSSDVAPTWAPPPVDETQWAWVNQTLSSATSDWIIVVGHHPVWSVGAYGPTWPLVDRLRPMMEAAGVALYVSGHEYQMEHFRSEPHLTGIDYLVAGNGAYAVNGSAASSHASEVVFGSLQFQYAAGTGFAAVHVTQGAAAAPSELCSTLYDASGAQLYSFYKENPRTAEGHILGDLGSPPGPGEGRGVSLRAAEAELSTRGGRLAAGGAAAFALASCCLLALRALATEAQQAVLAEDARASAKWGGGGGGGDGGGGGGRAPAAKPAWAPVAQPGAAAAAERAPLLGGRKPGDGVQLTDARRR
jgi:hypothetical protein